MSEYSLTWISQIWGEKIRTERTFGAHIGSHYPLVNLIVSWAYELENNTRILSSEPTASSESIARHVTPICSFEYGGSGYLDNQQRELWIEFLWNIRSPLTTVSGSQNTTRSSSSSSGVSGGAGGINVESGSSSSTSRSRGSGFDQSYIAGSAIYRKFVATRTGNWFKHANSRDIRDGTEIRAYVDGDEERYRIYQHHTELIMTSRDGRFMGDARSDIQQARAAAPGAH